jgi:hypothetical protein
MGRANGRAVVVVSVIAAVVALTAVWIGVTSGQAATSMPADKMTVAGSKVETATPGENVTLLSARMRTSSTEDLILQVTAECSLTTNVTTVGNDNSRAFGQVRLWVEVDGKQVPISSDSNDGKVVFCNRAYQRTTEGFDDQDATIKTFFKTREANAFNWVALNVGNGIHLIEVKGELTKEATTNATAEAAVGNRTVVVEPTHAAHNETLN